LGRFLCAEFHVRAESSKDGRPLVSEMEGMAQAVACRYSRALVALLGTFGREVVLINGCGHLDFSRCSQAIIRILLRAIPFW